MTLPNWQDLCRLNESAGSGWDDILIKLSCGLTLTGRISCEDAKQLLREPTTDKPIERNAQDGAVRIVLPVSRILSVSYPTELPLRSDDDK